MMNWNEVIKKEAATSRIYEDFTVNTKSLTVYADKPNNCIGTGIREKPKTEEQIHQEEEFESTKNIRPCETT